MRCVNICRQAMISNKELCAGEPCNTHLLRRAFFWRAFLFAAATFFFFFAAAIFLDSKKHTRAWIAAVNMRGDVSAHDSAWPLSPSRWCLFLWDSSVTAINICLSVYNCIEAVLTHEHQRRQKDNRNKRFWPSHRWRYLMLYVLVGHRMWFLRMSGIYGNSSYNPNRMPRPFYKHWGWLAHLINCCMSKYCTLVEVCEAYWMQ